MHREPTEKTAAFVTAQNKLIDDTNALYNLRMDLHLHHHYKEKSEGQLGSHKTQRLTIYG